MTRAQHAPSKSNTARIQRPMGSSALLKCQPWWPGKVQCQTCQYCSIRCAAVQVRKKKKKSFKLFDSSSTCLNSHNLQTKNLITISRIDGGEIKGANIVEHVYARHSTCAVLLGGYNNPWCRYDYLHFREKKMEAFVWIYLLYLLKKQMSCQ